MMETVKTVYYDQSDILRGIMKLCGIERFCADVTYGNGQFYKKGIEQPEHKFDIDPQLDGVTQASSTELPLNNESISSVVFDPPFLTYVKAARQGNGNMVMAKRFSGYWAYSELEEHYSDTFKECHRVLKKGGFMIVKCQDIIHNHKLHATHINCVEWAKGFRLRDIYILPAKHRMPAPNRKGTQKHPRIFHSYFMVFERR